MLSSTDACEIKELQTWEGGAALQCKKKLRLSTAIMTQKTSLFKFRIAKYVAEYVSALWGDCGQEEKARVLGTTRYAGRSGLKKFLHVCDD
jgi:hypothetical protein